MGTNTLNNRSAGQTILDTFFNDIHSAMNGDFVGRNSTGVPTSGQNLGTTALPWGTIRGASLVLDGAAVDTSTIVSTQNRVVSGAKRASSNQPAYIIPNGAAASFVVDGTPTNLVLDINGAAVTVSTDITKSSLTTAPSSNNTALVDDAAAADQFETKTWGERGSGKNITIDNVGSEISGLVGKWAAFKIAGVAEEYFLAFVESATVLSKCYRGFFYNSSLAPINRTGFSNNDTITLMSLGWIFVENDATTVDVTYNNPVWSFTSPSGPATGDYWYDMGNDVWKRYDGASFQIINRTWIGMAVIDTSNCVAARCVEFHANYKADNSVDLEVQSTEIIRTKLAESRVSVAGNDIRFRNSLSSWNITTDLATSADMYDATEQSSRVYYLYVKDDGDTVMSDISPYYRADLLGLYHPHNPWRCVGLAQNDSSSNLISASKFVIPVVSIQHLTSGSGNYTTGLLGCAPSYIRVRMCGGGGGGGGAGTNDGGTGGTGGTTTFGTSLLTCVGGTGGSGASTAGGQPAGGAGGTATVASPAIGLALTGGGGMFGVNNNGTAEVSWGGMGGQNPFGGAGAGAFATTGVAGTANTGAGGQGGGTATGNIEGGGGGGAGGWIDAIILNPYSTYAYAVGAGGNVGAAGTGGNAGGAGGSGRITVEEVYSDVLI